MGDVQPVPLEEASEEAIEVIAGMLGIEDVGLPASPPPRRAPLAPGAPR